MINKRWKGVNTVIFVPYWICICKSFPFRRKIYRRRVFKWITQRDLLTFALVKLLAFVLLFKHVLNYFELEMAAIVVAENRERVDFSSLINLFGKNTLSEHIVVIFNLLQIIKDDFEPLSRSHTIPALSKLLANLNFLAFGSFQCTVASLFLYSWLH